MSFRLYIFKCNNLLTPICALRILRGVGSSTGIWVIYQVSHHFYSFIEKNSYNTFFSMFFTLPQLFPDPTHPALCSFSLFQQTTSNKEEIKEKKHDPSIKTQE